MRKRFLIISGKDFEESSEMERAVKTTQCGQFSLVREWVYA